jgi:3-oxoacyl-[acyl-carrier protein] reductase
MRLARPGCRGRQDVGRAIERVQVPDDLVGAVIFLSSAASDFMTGQTINVDGGKEMH